MGGQIDLMHDNALTSGPLVKDGKLRAFGFAQGTRFYWRKARLRRG